MEVVQGCDRKLLHLVLLTTSSVKTNILLKVNGYLTQAWIWSVVCGYGLISLVWFVAMVYSSLWFVAMVV